MRRTKCIMKDSVCTKSSLSSDKHDKRCELYKLNKKFYCRKNSHAPTSSHSTRSDSDSDSDSGDATAGTHSISVVLPVGSTEIATSSSHRKSSRTRDVRRSVASTSRTTQRAGAGGSVHRSRSRGSRASTGLETAAAMAKAARTAAPVVIPAGTREGFEDVEIPGVGALSVAIPRGPFMSGGTESDVSLFRALEVYPALRVGIMKQVAEVMKNGIPDTRSGHHKLNDVLRMLGDAKALAQGAYGVVIAVCLSNALTEIREGSDPPMLRPYRDSRCWKISVAGKGAARGTGAELMLQMAMKVQNINKKTFGKDFENAAHAHPTRMRGGKYVAHKNPWREVLMGRAANMMVQANITPHTVLFYTAYLVDDVPASQESKDGEVCSMLAEAIKNPTATCIKPSTVTCDKPRSGGVVVGVTGADGKCPKDFVPLRGEELGLTSIQEWSDFHAEKFVTEIANEHTAVDVYRSMVVQIIQGLLAFQMHLGLVHSDFHGENAMANVVAHTDIAYLVPRAWDGKRLPKKSDVCDVYVVPTHGYLWKVMDLGMSSSNALFGETDVMDNAMAANSKYMQGWANEATQPEASRVSFDLFDITRIISYLYTEMAGQTVAAYTRGGQKLTTIKESDVERVVAIERSTVPRDVHASVESLAFMKSILNEAELLSKTNGMRLETGLVVPAKKGVRFSRDEEESKDGDGLVRTADIKTKAHEFFDVPYSEDGTTGELMPVEHKNVSRRDAFIHTLFTGRLLRLFAFAAAPYKKRSQREIPKGTPIFDMRNRMETGKLGGLEASFYQQGTEPGTFAKFPKPTKTTRKRR